MGKTPVRKVMSMPTIPDRRIDGQPPLSAPEAIARRRATRHFDPDCPVPDDILKRILHLATLAPSGYNLQPWRFLVVRDPKVKEAVGALYKRAWDETGGPTVSVG